MRFTPVSEEVAAGCFPKGEYDAVVAKAEQKVSKKGNDMIELELTVFGPDGVEAKVKDWILSNDTGAYKLQRFCKSSDLWDLYQAGEISADHCKDQNVTVKLGIQDDNADFPPRNKIVDYMPRKLSAPKPASELQGVDPTKQRAPGTGRADPTKPPTGDDIPF